jgi:integrase/recombinase XerD
MNFVGKSRPICSAVSRRKRARCTLEVTDWPAKDREAWELANRPGSKLRPGGAVAHWAVSSQQNAARAYGRWLFWCASRGRLHPDATPASRFTQERVLDYVAYLQEHLGEVSVAMQVDKLHQAARAMMPTEDWSMLETVCRNLQRNVTTANDKAARLLHARELFEFGLRLVGEAEDSGNIDPVQRAVLFRDGLLIAFVAARPLRKRNIKGMCLGSTFIRENGRCRLRFSAGETKNRRSIDLSCPEALTEVFDKYLKVHRNVLLARASSPQPDLRAVWISTTGRPMDDMAIYRVTTTRTLAEFGKAVNPHLFRDCAATTIAIDDPICVQIVMHILGHTRLATAERHYNQARGVEAGRSLITLIEDQRSELADQASRQRCRMPDYPHKRLGRAIDRPRRRRRR